MTLPDWKWALGSNSTNGWILTSHQVCPDGRLHTSINNLLSLPWSIFIANCWCYCKVRGDSICKIFKKKSLWEKRYWGHSCALHRYIHGVFCSAAKTAIVYTGKTNHKVKHMIYNRSMLVWLVCVGAYTCSQLFTHQSTETEPNLFS